jgi:hypothetical protein
MTDARTALKSLIIYAVCIPLALVLGYLLANPLDLQGLTLMGAIFLVLCAPLVIHYHYPFMLLAWNLGAVVFFLPGRMSLWMVAILLSYGVSFTHRILDRKLQFLRVPELVHPLIAFTLVVVVTAELRGGFGFRFMGGESVGGRRYVELLIGILGFFALTTRRIAPASVPRYLALFYLGGLGAAIAILYDRVPHYLDPVFLFIPPQTLDPTGEGAFIAFRPLGWPAVAIVSYLLARYGIRGMLTPGRRWLLLIFFSSLGIVLFSGSRLGFVIVAMTLALQFWLEGFARTRIMPFALGLLFLAAAVALPFANRLPLSMQRALAVLPKVQVDPSARIAADASSEWRREIWRVAIPQIPQFLLLGKGYTISREDYGFMTDRSFDQSRAENRAATLAGDYHNGPLSVILTFGIWGVMAFAWFLIAAFGAISNLDLLSCRPSTPIC